MNTTKNTLGGNPLESILNGEVYTIAIDNSFAEQYNPQSCDCDRCVIVMKDRVFLAVAEKKDEGGAISLKEIPTFDKELFSLRIEPKPGKDIRFVKLLCHPDGTIDAIKYRFGNDYLFIFASEYNLIITKSICDLTEEDDMPIPEADPSVLFE